ncbi:DNA topoisomerase III [Burkholderiales bacterium GJ-E10]|nr:DNA topoisomerase III [Burkholderiales bacterium GJ-E10]
MRIFIAEKPSVAKAIAGVLGGASKVDGYIECGSLATRVTWCFGHLLEQAPPEEYVAGEGVRPEDLPVIPERWKLSPRDGAAGKQIKVIRDLLKDATEVVNAGDADREGQLLVDEVLLFLGWTGKTSRLWLSSLDDESVQRALVTLKPNAALAPLYESALARQRADWLLGMNGSIAISRNLQAAGVQGSWSIGRVQTPTLALLVDRKREIGGFAPRDHYRTEALLAGGIRALWRIPEDMLTDGLLLEKSAAEATASAVRGRPARVEKFTRKTAERAAPLPYTLSALQKAASRRLGLSAKDTLAAAQELYEAKITTYPRTDCPYLPEEMHREAGRILKALGAEGGGIDPARRHAAWNTAKVEAHHGIVPTGANPDAAGLSANAGRVFGLIRESYVRLFLSAEKFETREALFVFPGGERFRAAARIVLEPGWTDLGGKEEGEADPEEVSGALPELVEGQTLACEAAQVLAKRTAPPEPYTDGTMIAAMTGVHKLVADAKLKARLKETSGLGTEATRASMIETLIARGYAERKAKEIHPTGRGEQLIDMLRNAAPELADPGYTALQEDALADIAARRGTIADFLRAQREAVTRTTRLLLAAQLCAPVPMQACPACGASRCVQRTSKAGKPYHRCLDCQAAFADERGKPGKRFEDKPAGEGGSAKQPATGPKCPECKKPTFRNETKTGKLYFRCAACKGAWWPDREDPAKTGKKLEAK